MSISSLGKNVFYWMLERMPPHVSLSVIGYKRLGYWLNVRKPRTFNEKVNWRKLYQKDPRFDVLSDKQNSKEYIDRKVGPGYVVPTLWCGTDLADIPWQDLPYPLVLKRTLSNEDVYFVNSLAEVDKEKVRRHFGKFNTDGLLQRYNRELPENLNQRFIIEPLLGGGRGIPDDYKFFCYHGRAHFIQVDSNRFSEERSRRVYDRDWNPLDTRRITREPWALTPPVPKPDQYEHMLEVVEKLAADFDFIRVDLYLEGDRIYCGELTFRPSSGFVRFDPPHWDLAFGTPWKTGAE